MMRAFLLVVLLAGGCAPDTSDIFGQPAGAGGAASSGVTTSGVTTGTVTASSNATTGVTTGEGTTATTTASVTTGGGAATYCNGGKCVAGQVCCYSNTVVGLDKCATDGTCLPGDVELKCNGPAECPGGSCCGGWTPQMGWQSTECKAQCDATDRVMCFGDNSVCPPGKSCIPSQALGNGYSYCG